MNWIAITKKDFKISLKDPSAIVVLLLLPIMFISIMSFALMNSFGSKGSPIKILYVDKDNTSKSKDFVKELETVDSLSFVKMSSEVAGKNQIDKGDYAALVTIPNGFSGAIADNKSTSLAIYGDALQTTTVNIVEQAIAGKSRQFELEYQLKAYAIKQGEMTYQLVNSQVTTAIQEIESKLSTPIQIKTVNGVILQSQATSDTKNAMNSIINKNLINQKNSTNNSSTKQPNSFQQNVPGYTVMFAFFIIMFAGKTFLREKELGTWNRIMIAEVSTPSIYLGKFAPNFLIGLIQVTLLLSFGHFAFGMGLGSSLFAVIALSLGLIICSTSLGMLIASIAKTDSQITAISLFLVLFTAALGGTMVPLQMMPNIMQNISKFVPQSWALNGYQNLFVRDQGVSGVLPNIGVLLSFSLIFVLVSFTRINSMRKER